MALRQRAGQDCGSFARADKYPETAPNKLFFQAKMGFLENPFLSTTKITIRAAMMEGEKTAAAITLILDLVVT